MLSKEKYVKVIQSFEDKNIQSFLLTQLEEFYNLSTKTLKNTSYKIGDSVKLSKDTYLHGFGDSLDVLDLFSEYGLINKDFEFGVTKHFVRYAISLWHIKKPILLHDYIVNYSGMTVEYEKEYKMIPYGKLDEFVEKMRKVPHFMWTAESTMEIRFMPSLAKDSNQLAFIINGRDKECATLFNNNILNEKAVPYDTALFFLAFKRDDHKEEFRLDRHKGQSNRIAYIPFGLPANCIEGVLVGRKYEKNKKILSHIKERLPHCYICNLDGIVIG